MIAELAEPDGSPNASVEGVIGLFDYFSGGYLSLVRGVLGRLGF